MFELVTWVFGIAGALLAMIINIALLVVGVLIAVIVRKLPREIRRLVSALATAAVALYFFNGIAAHAIYFFAWRSFTTASLFINASQVSLLCCLLIMTVGQLIYIFARPDFKQGVLISDLSERYCSKDKKDSASSFNLKVSSVLLQ